MEDQEETQNQVNDTVHNEKQDDLSSEIQSEPVVDKNVKKSSGSNKGLIIGIGCVVILILLVVCGVLFALFGATLFAINPSEAFKDARNVRRQQDVDALTAGLQQYILRDLNGDISTIANAENCNLVQGLQVIDPNDGIAPNEGLPIESLSVCISDYIAGIPSSVEGSSYRWGVDNAEFPAIIFVGVDSMDSVDGTPVSDYYRTIELYSY